MPSYIKSGGLISTECEPKQQIEKVADFLIHNNEQHYNDSDAEAVYENRRFTLKTHSNYCETK